MNRAPIATRLKGQTWFRRGERRERAYMVDLRSPRSSLRENRVANASMVMTYDRRRVVSRAGRVNGDTLKAIDRALAMHLGLAEPVT